MFLSSFWVTVFQISIEFTGNNTQQLPWGGPWVGGGGGSVDLCTVLVCSTRTKGRKEKTSGYKILQPPPKHQESSDDKSRLKTQPTRTTRKLLPLAGQGHSVHSLLFDVRQSKKAEDTYRSDGHSWPNVDEETGTETALAQVCAFFQGTQVQISCVVQNLRCWKMFPQRLKPVNSMHQFSAVGFQSAEERKHGSPIRWALPQQHWVRIKVLLLDETFARTASSFGSTLSQMSNVVTNRRERGSNKWLLLQKTIFLRQSDPLGPSLFLPINSNEEKKKRLEEIWVVEGNELLSLTCSKNKSRSTRTLRRRTTLSGLDRLVT